MIWDIDNRPINPWVAQMQVPRHEFRVVQDDAGQEHVEIQVQLPGEVCHELSALSYNRFIQ